ncbi:concanavalin A-like lectin/glucanase domain-containing protein [Cercophora scortea]|uniref:Concanavalin A-like lectin/glucanase domain-containing protein n=1 Tax=Cercophora scortea TaxID=314031 RepID=A0AAE0IYP2_9PEZI|nr:concanavalin A-like lectin/glucanase domain-containing protein [Cercophora scortea]
MRVPLSLGVFVAGLAQTQAQYLLNDLSFGYGARISPDDRNSIPNFGMQGRPNVPELLSNKVILTPPAPGNQRGAVWADHSLQQQNWIVDVEFRANGPERGGGNLNIWLVRDGAHSVGSGSIYTVGKFEGLALVVDQHGGTGGMVRGFLNDGSTDYKSHHNVDNMAFGHCLFSYRNLGRPSQIKLRHNENKFQVEVDSRLCFESDKIRLPSGYNFGITAASADNPDSFEVFKLVVLSEDGHHNAASTTNNNNNNNNNAAAQGHVETPQQPIGGAAAAEERPHMHFGRGGQNIKVPDDPFDTAIPDVAAEKITSSAAQFADLHSRIQSLNHHLSTIFRQVAQSTNVGEQRHEELSIMLGELKGLLTRLDKLDTLETKFQSLERDLRSLRSDMSAKLRDSENAIKYHVSDKHESLADHVKAHASTGHSRLIFVIVGCQLVMAGGYVYYKRKKSMPKKYL